MVRDAMKEAIDTIKERRQEALDRKERKRKQRTKEEKEASCRRVKALSKHSEFLLILFGFNTDNRTSAWVELLGRMIKTEWRSLEESNSALPATEETPTGLVDDFNNLGPFSEEQPGHVFHEVVLSHIIGVDACSTCTSDPRIKTMATCIKEKLPDAKLDVLLGRPLDSREAQDAATLRKLFYAKAAEALLQNPPLQYLGIKSQSEPSEQASRAHGEIFNPAAQKQPERGLSITSWILGFTDHLLELLEDCQLSASYFVPSPPRSNISDSNPTDASPLLSVDFTVLDSVLNSTIYPDALWPEPAVASTSPTHLLHDFMTFIDTVYTTTTTPWPQWSAMIKAKLEQYRLYREAVASGAVEEVDDVVGRDIRVLYANDEEEGHTYRWGRPVGVRDAWYEPEMDADDEEEDRMDEDYESDWEVEPKSEIKDVVVDWSELVKLMELEFEEEERGEKRGLDVEVEEEEAGGLMKRERV